MLITAFSEIPFLRTNCLLLSTKVCHCKTAQTDAVQRNLFLSDFVSWCVSPTEIPQSFILYISAIFVNAVGVVCVHTFWCFVCASCSLCRLCLATLSLKVSYNSKWSTSDEWCRWKYLEGIGRVIVQTFIWRNLFSSRKKAGHLMTRLWYEPKTSPNPYTIAPCQHC